jgi:hypothetical protein
MRVLVLVIASFDKPVYYDMLNVWKTRLADNDVTDGSEWCITDVWFVRSKPDSEWIGDIVNDILDPELRDKFELDILNKTIFVRGDECLIPGILNKTVEAISYFLGELERSLRPITPPSQNENTTKLIQNENTTKLIQNENTTKLIQNENTTKLIQNENTTKLIQNENTTKLIQNENTTKLIPHYDFIWRTNLSSVLDFRGLHAYISGLQSSVGFYGGYIGKASSYFFASGAGFLMSRDVASYLVTNKHLLRWDLIDDVAIGALLDPRFGLVPIDRCWVDENFSGCPDVFHFRCESYLHLRTVEFMNVVKGTLGSTSLRPLNQKEP